MYRETPCVYKSIVYIIYYIYFILFVCVHLVCCDVCTVVQVLEATFSGEFIYKMSGTFPPPNQC